MSEEIETGTQTPDSSSETIEFRFRREPEMDAQVTESSFDELTLRTVDEWIKQMESAGNNEASCSGVIMCLLAPQAIGKTLTKQFRCSIGVSCHCLDQYCSKKCCV